MSEYSGSVIPKGIKFSNLIIKRKKEQEEIYPNINKE
jgi:hypothetical protein